MGLLRRAQRRGLYASSQNTFQRAFIIDHHVGLFHAKLSQRFSHYLLNRSAKLLFHNAVDFQLNARLRRGPILTITSLDSSVPAVASIFISIGENP